MASWKLFNKLRDGLEDALNELLEQLPKLIARSAESALKDSQPVKRDAGSVALSNLIKRVLKLSVLKMLLKLFQKEIFLL